MRPQITVQPLRWWHHALDFLLLPVMHVVTGTFYIRGQAQRTHRWHCQQLTEVDLSYFNRRLMVSASGDPTASVRHRRGIPLNHLTILGGWKQFVVLETPFANAPWHVGWRTVDSCVVHRLPLTGSVKVLIGREPIEFFAICAQNHVQIPVYELDGGRLWEDNARAVPLL